MSLRLSLALALVASTLATQAAEAAQAAQATQIQAATVLVFRTPSGNIGCVYSSGNGGRVLARLRCDIRSGLRPSPRRPARCDLDYGDSLELPSLGRASIVCHGDTALDPRAPVLAYGRTWQRSGLRCVSRSTGLRCTNRGGHGFFLSRESWDAF